ncbi:dockerin type I domain-containing protein [Lacipirellula sp.]|uniref:dockerin type I domain-containing protein n=1 Tax=Lacipirellula sp. TaxID=2691419 RepID=UPI003D122957
MVRVVSLLLVALAVSFGGPSLRAADYSEFVTGDLSGNPALPTLWSLTPGGNTLVASSSAVDQDLLRFDVPTGYVLSSIVVQFHESPSRVFTGIQTGTTWTAGVGFEIDPTNMLGWVDFPFNPEHSHQETDILAAIGEAPGSIGFAPPLASGSYTMLFQAPSSIVPFALQFNVTQVGGGLSADFNRDGFVNGADLAMWRQAFGAGAGADANQDGRTDGSDFVIWQRQNGQSGSISAIPEPASIMLAMLGIGAAACRRERLARRRSGIAGTHQGLAQRVPVTEQHG